MSKKMLVNAAQEGEVRVAIVEDQVLEDLSIAVDGTEMQRGNIYKGIVVTIETGLQAAFVDFGEDRNGFITFNDIHPKYYNVKVDKKRGRPRIQDAIKPGAELLVQVHKEAVGNKGAALTTDITMPGRFLVYTPLSTSSGVSRKIEDEAIRKRLKNSISRLDVPEDGGVIVRTAGQDESKKALAEDFQHLLRLWGHIRARFDSSAKPTIVHREPDVIIRTIRDYLKLDVEELIVDDEDVYTRLTEYFTQDAPDIVDRLKMYRGKMPIFSNYGLEKQLGYISSHKVPLPSGGSIVINPTEALTAVDVNSGKSRGQDNQEIMAYQTNLEAATAVARQLRLRDVGGLIVVDFIDMMEMKHRRAVTKALKDAMKKDKARVEIGRISKFGLLELSRQRIKARLLMSSHDVCPHCEGSGYLMTKEFQAMNMIRRLQELAVSAPRGSRIHGRLPTSVALCLLNEHRSSISELETRFQVDIQITPDPDATGTRDTFDINVGGDEMTAGEANRKNRKGKDRRGHRPNNRKDQRRQESKTQQTASEHQLEVHAEKEEESKKAPQKSTANAGEGLSHQTSPDELPTGSPRPPSSSEAKLNPDKSTPTVTEDKIASEKRAAARARIKAKREKRNQLPPRSTHSSDTENKRPASVENGDNDQASKVELLKAASRRAASKLKKSFKTQETERTIEKSHGQSVDGLGPKPKVNASQSPKETSRTSRRERTTAKEGGQIKSKSPRKTTNKPLNLKHKLKTKLAGQSEDAVSSREAGLAGKVEFETQEKPAVTKEVVAQKPKADWKRTTDKLKARLKAKQPTSETEARIEETKKPKSRTSATTTATTDASDEKTTSTTRKTSTNQTKRTARPKKSVPKAQKDTSAKSSPTKTTRAKKVKSSAGDEQMTPAAANDKSGQERSKLQAKPTASVAKTAASKTTDVSADTAPARSTRTRRSSSTTNASGRKPAARKSSSATPAKKSATASKSSPQKSAATKAPTNKGKQEEISEQPAADTKPARRAEPKKTRSATTRKPRSAATSTGAEKSAASTRKSTKTTTRKTTANKKSAAKSSEAAKTTKRTARTTKAKKQPAESEEK